MKTALIIGYIVIVCWLFWKLATTAKRIHTDIDNLERKAKDACTAEELENAEVSLRVYAATMPKHRAFVSRINEVHSYLKGRMR